MIRKQLQKYILLQGLGKQYK